MYSMDNLLTLVDTEHAKSLKICAGIPPQVMLKDESHGLEGPPVTPELAEELLRSIANTRQMRELQENGSVTFLYKLMGSSPFLVQATLDQGTVAFQVE